LYEVPLYAYLTRCPENCSGSRSLPPLYSDYASHCEEIIAEPKKKARFDTYKNTHIAAPRY